VLLLGGPSGSGKSTVAEQVGRRFGVPWLQVDDLRLSLQASRVMLPQATESLYFFLAHPDVWALPPERLRDGLIAVGKAIAPAIAAVIEHHVATAKPLVIEGDGIHPSLIERPGVAEYVADGRVQAVFLIEPDEQVLLANSRGREGRRLLHLATEPTAQEWNMAGMNALYGQWIAAEAGHRVLPIVGPRPWATVAERVVSASTRHETP